LAVAMGGGIVGVWQGLLLAPHGVSMVAWTLASLAGWSAAAAMSGAIPVAAGPGGIGGALLYLGAVALAGATPGLVTGLVMRRVEVSRPGQCTRRTSLSSPLGGHHQAGKTAQRRSR